VRWEAERHTAFLLRKGLARGKSAVVTALGGAVQKKSTKRCPKRIRSFVVSLKSKTTSQPTNKSMNTQTDTKTESRSGKNNGAPASIVWFEIPVDNVERAKTFYGKLFGWKIERFPGPKPYWHIDTGGADATPDGGMMERQCQEHSLTNYVGVPSVEEAAAKVEKLGGKICMEKTAVPEMGYFVVCQDTENNTFALWERNEKAK
jgi:predicted enzyme related to lactoylglutathione lyase